MGFVLRTADDRTRWSYRTAYTHACTTRVLDERAKLGIDSMSTMSAVTKLVKSRLRGKTLRSIIIYDLEYINRKLHNGKQIRFLALYAIFICYMN